MLYYKIKCHTSLDKQLTVEGDGITAGACSLTAIRMSDGVSGCTCQHVERVSFHCERRSRYINVTS